MQINSNVYVYELQYNLSHNLQARSKYQHKIGNVAGELGLISYSAPFIY